MSKIIFNLFPNGKSKCVTFSYDDGRTYDIKMTEMFNKYGAKCTYNLNTSNVGRPNYIDADFVRELSKTHEIACHGYVHPFLERLPLGEALKEIYEDKKGLEEIIDKPVFGMAYPFGTYDNDVLTALKAVDIKYSRTVNSTNGFGVPRNFLEWHPTCHHNDCIEPAERFVKTNRGDRFTVLYIWGHSYEFNDNNNWEILEKALDILSTDDKIWYATNGELYDYLTAIKSLRVAINHKSVYNPTCITVYATVDGKPCEFKPGLTRI